MPKVHLISLGCDKNLSDSEKTLGLLMAEGYEYTDDPAAADLIVVNTCCFIRDAKQESVETLIEMADLKAARREAGMKMPLLLVMGCMAERYKEEITESLPEVDILVGTNSWQDISAAVAEFRKKGDKTSLFRPISENAFLAHPVTKRLITAGGHYSYLKIAEGCGKKCTYCIIPSLKGAYRSVPMEDLIREAEGLAEAGVRLYAGVQGSADEAAKALAEGHLDYDPNARCNHHEHHDGDCGHDHCAEHQCRGN